MCGIAGILLASSNADPRRLAVVRQMTQTLYHRGPDGSGLWADDPAGIALGHRRLAIVDLSESGHQPMISHGGDFVVTFNGEIYNFAELRTRLEDRGHRFRGHSDTEVMLTAFESFGVEEALDQFAGMFALAVWDRRHRVLHLARDRLGKKPLYVALVNSALVFASELKALEVVPGFRRVIDADALAMVLRQGWIPDHRCIWRDVFKLTPGSLLSLRPADLDTLTVTGMRARTRCWWRLSQIAAAGQEHPLDPDDPEIELELARRLRLAVRERMVADVPIGAFLSGGIDSATVVALMQAQSARPIRTFTIGYCERQYDEASYAAQVARHLGTEHTEFRLSPAEACAVIPELPAIWDEPFADESQIPSLLISRLARRHVTVALTGDGGDECFGGYARHFSAHRLAFVLGLPLGLRRAAAALTTRGTGTWQILLRSLPLADDVRQGLSSRKFASVLTSGDEHELYTRLTSLGQRTERSTSERDTDPIPPLPDLASRLMYRDMMGYLPGDILVKLDRASMAVSLETRCPLLDHRVVEFAWRLPTSVKIRNGKGKSVLRQILRHYLPDRLFERPKHGFDVPIGAWLKGPLRDWAEAVLARPMLAQEGLLDLAQIRRSWEEHISGRRDCAYEVWAVLMAEAWFTAARPPNTASVPPEAATYRSDALGLASAVNGKREDQHGHREGGPPHLTPRAQIAIAGTGFAKQCNMPPVGEPT